LSIKKEGILRVKMCEDIANSDRNNMITQNCKSFVCPLSPKTEFWWVIDFWYAESFAAGGKEEANGL
jgi:hypothetical protein